MLKRTYLTVAIIAIAIVAMFPFDNLAKEIKRPKNIIVFISDGWSENHILASNYYNHGKAIANKYQEFPINLFLSTYPGRGNSGAKADFNVGYNSYKAWNDFNYNQQGYWGIYADDNTPIVTGSEAAATTMSTGEKTYAGSIGMKMSKDYTKKVAKNEDTSPLTHALNHAEALGKSTGVVSSVQFSHATPAGFVAHTWSRNNYAEIANEMIFNSPMEVIMGCGNPEWSANGTPAVNDYKYVGGTTTWNKLKNGETDWTLITSKEDFTKYTTGETPRRLIGVPETYQTLQHDRSGNIQAAPFVEPFNPRATTLVDMTKAAINVLDNNKNGFFVMIEGGAVDWAGHANSMGRMIEEQTDFDMSVAAAIEWVEANSSWEETLIIVTGDHETGYLTGPLTNDNKPTTNPIVNNGKGNVPSYKWNSGGHTNMLIPFFAKGPGSELFDLYADEVDHIRGRFLDNTDLGLGLKRLMPLPNEAVKAPKNVIFMISDGWGINAVKATDYFTGKTQEFETFPVQTYMSTYPARESSMTLLSGWDKWYNPFSMWNSFTWCDKGYTCSGAAATAMAIGRKAYNKSIGYDANGELVKNISEMYMENGRAAGTVSSVQFSHATPAGFSAHNVTRDNYQAITDDIVYNGKYNVILGCGNPEWSDNNVPQTPKYNYIKQTTWEDLKANRTGYSLITKKADFEALMTGNTPNRLIGVPEVFTTLQQCRAGDGMAAAYAVPFTQDVPTLDVMTKVALNVLDNNQNGFFVMIEGGAVDWAAHANQKGRIIEEQQDFNKAVEAVINWIETNSNWNETLLIVTGDHETGHLTGPLASDNNPFTNPIVDNGKNVMPGMKFNSGEHTNQLIPFYAKGASAEIFNSLAGDIDYVYGPYITNTEMAIAVEQMVQLPNKLTVNGSNFEVCDGESVKFTTAVTINGNQVDAFVTGGSGNYSYEWMPNGAFDNNKIKNPTLLKAVSSVPYTVKVTDNVTQEIVYGNVYINVESVPNFTLELIYVGKKGTKVDLNSLITDAPKDVTFVWSDGVNKLTNTEVTIAKGVQRYYVTAYSLNGCDSREFKVVVYGKNGKESIEREEISAGKNNKNFMYVYPTPAENNINLVISSEEERYGSVSIYDLAGNRVLVQNEYLAYEGEYSVNISTLPSGTYYVVVSTSEDTIVSRIIKK